MIKMTSLAKLTLLVGLCTSTTVSANALKKTEFDFSGYIKLDAIASSYSDGTLGAGSIGRDFYIPSLTPVGGNDEETQFDAHIRQSRFRFTTTTEMENKQTIKGVLEFDMQVVPDGNERISNSHQPRVRHAFLQYGNWLMGQTWSTFQDVKALPETMDFIGVTDGTVFARQAMIRYTHGNFQVALENPETTVTPYGGGGRIVTDDGAVPDVVVRYQQSADWGHFAAAFLARQLSYQNKTGDLNIETTETSYGLSLTGKVKFGQDDLRVMFTTGSGLGRYLGLNVANGAVLDANNELNAIDSTGFSIAYRHLWDSQWRSNLMYSQFTADNDTSITGTGVTKTTYSTRVNLVYSPTKALSFGGEYTFAQREVESGLEGDMNRLQFSAKYAF